MLPLARNSESPARSHPLGIQEAEQLLLIVLAERCADAHVMHDRTGDARRETLRSCMAARAVLLKDALSLIPWLM